MTKLFCKTCSTAFKPKSPRQIYCSKRCDKIAFYHRHKKINDKNKYPHWCCPECRYEIKLFFSPIKQGEKLQGSLICPICTVLSIDVSDALNAGDDLLI